MWIYHKYWEAPNAEYNYSIFSYTGPISSLQKIQLMYTSATQLVSQIIHFLTCANKKYRSKKLPGLYVETICVASMLIIMYHCTKYHCQGIQVWQARLKIISLLKFAL